MGRWKNVYDIDGWKWGGSVSWYVKGPIYIATETRLNEGPIKCSQVLARVRARKERACAKKPKLILQVSVHRYRPSIVYLDSFISANRPRGKIAVGSR